jgi:hypothetical protein
MRITKALRVLIGNFEHVERLGFDWLWYLWHGGTSARIKGVVNGLF